MVSPSLVSQASPAPSALSSKASMIIWCNFVLNAVAFIVLEVSTDCMCVSESVSHVAICISYDPCASRCTCQTANHATTLFIVTNVIMSERKCFVVYCCEYTEALCGANDVINVSLCYRAASIFGDFYRRRYIRLSFCCEWRSCAVTGAFQMHFACQTSAACSKPAANAKRQFGITDQVSHAVRNLYSYKQVRYLPITPC